LRGNNKPFFADGSIVGDYTLLIEYIELLKQNGLEEKIEKVLLSEEDFQYVKRLIESKSRINLDKLLEEATERFKQRIDPEVAVEAVKRTLKTTVSPRDAVEMISRIIAGWLIEAANTLGLIRLRKRR
jgi:hypothetical protein